MSMCQRAATMVLGLTLVVLAAGVAAAETYPGHPVTLVVPFAPGGTTDILGRVFAQKMSEAWGQPVVVKNESGAGGMIGSASVARSAPDGYTILLGTLGTHGTSINLYKKVPYHPEKDFTPITLLCTFPNMLVVSPSIPATTLKEFIAYVQARPGKLSYASAGAGTGSHLAAEMFKRVAGLDVVHVPYRGSAPALTDVIAGHVAFALDYTASAMAHVKGGKLRALAVTGATRTRAAPDVPTAIEGGLPGFNTASWVAVYAPKGTPPDVVTKIRDTIAKAATLPDVQKRMDELAVDAVANTPDEFARFQRAEIDRWGSFIRDINLRID